MHTIQAERMNKIRYSPDGRFSASLVGHEKMEFKRFSVKLQGKDEDKRIFGPLSAAPSLLANDATLVPPLRGVCFSPDGCRVAVIANQRCVCVWDVDGGPTPRILREPYWLWGTVTGICFSPDGRLFVNTSRDTPPFRHHAAFLSDGELFTKSVREETDEGEFFYTAMALSPNDRHLALACDNGDILLRTLRGKEEKHPLGGLFGHTDAVTSVAFSSDNHLLASGSLDGTARLWRVPLREQEHAFRDHTQEVLDVAFSPDTKLLALASADGRVRVWEVTPGGNPRCLGVFREHEKRRGRAAGVAFSPDGGLLATCGDDGKVCLVNTGNFIKEMTVAKPAESPEERT